MVDGFAFSEVVRKLANLIRIGKITEIDGANVKVKIGKVITGWLPIVSQAGDTGIWTPISLNEQVIVFSPYGESAQAFVLRSINYDNFKTPYNLSEFNFSTNSDVKIFGEQNCSVRFNSRLEVDATDLELFSPTSVSVVGYGKIKMETTKASIELGHNSITLRNGSASINISDSGITLSCGSSTINLSNSNISLSSESISTNPPVCRCEGGL